MSVQKLDCHTLKGDSSTITKILLLCLSMKLQRQPLRKVSSRSDFFLRNVQSIPAHVVLGKDDEKKPVLFVKLQVTSNPDNTFNENNLNNDIFVGNNISPRGMVNYHTVNAELETGDHSCEPNGFISMIQGGATYGRRSLWAKRTVPRLSRESLYDGQGVPPLEFKAEIVATNGGVVHIINQVLLPSAESIEQGQLVSNCAVWDIGPPSTSSSSYEGGTFAPTSFSDTDFTA